MHGMVVVAMAVPWAVTVNDPPGHEATMQKVTLLEPPAGMITGPGSGTRVLESLQSTAFAANPLIPVIATLRSESPVLLSVTVTVIGALTEPAGNWTWLSSEEPSAPPLFKS